MRLFRIVDSAKVLKDTVFDDCESAHRVPTTDPAHVHPRPISRRLLDRCVAAAVFGVALLLYGSTVVPTVAFWDTGEFIASAHTLQANHQG